MLPLAFNPEEFRNSQDSIQELKAFSPPPCRGGWARTAQVNCSFFFPGESRAKIYLPNPPILPEQFGTPELQRS